jgi:hypothetical protein
VELAGEHVRHLVVVGDDHDRRPGLVQLVQQHHDIGAGLAVESPCRFVGQQDGGVPDERPSDCDPLALTPGQLVGTVVGAVGEPDPRQGLLGPSAPVRQRQPGVEQAATLSRALTPGERKNCWNTKPMRWARSADSCRSVSVPTSSPATRTVPASERSSVPRMLSMVVLPEPDGPTMPTSSPRSMSRSTARRARTGGRPG